MLDLLPPVCAERWEEVRFVATSLKCSLVKDGKTYDLLPPVCASVKDGKKYDLLPPVCGARWPPVCVKDGKKYNLLPPVFAERWEEVRFVATSL